MRRGPAGSVRSELFTFTLGGVTAVHVCIQAGRSLGVSSQVATVRRTCGLRAAGEGGVRQHDLSERTVSWGGGGCFLRIP